MASADFSQFVVTTAHETACETSPVKVRSLSLHAPAASTRTSDNFWTSVSFATLSAFPSLICGSCPSGQRFAYSFFQIPPHDGHPCCSAMYFVVVYAHSGLSPVRERPCRANKTGEAASQMPSPRLNIKSYSSAACPQAFITHCHPAPAGLSRILSAPKPRRSAPSPLQMPPAGNPRSILSRLSPVS